MQDVAGITHRSCTVSHGAHYPVVTTVHFTQAYCGKPMLMARTSLLKQPSVTALPCYSYLLQGQSYRQQR